MSSKCQRCSRANRECVYTTHSKTRRRKRTDTRVKELEEKVRGLSMMLENRAAASTHSSAEREILESTEFDEDDKAQKSNHLGAIAQLGNFGGVTQEGFSPFMKPPVSVQNRDKIDARQALGQSKEAMFGPTDDLSEPSPIFPDVIDRGILSMHKATELYKRYVNELAPL